MQVCERPTNYALQRLFRKQEKAKRAKTDEIKPKDRRCALRVKLKSLAAEAKIIRQEEKRTRSLSQYEFLRGHRIGVVRQEARCALLALAYIKGMAYRQVETPSEEKRLQRTPIARIASMVKAYGNEFGRIAEIEVKVTNWVNG